MGGVLDETPRVGGQGDRRSRIVAAMVDSCAEKTYAETTIADIVARAAISRTTFYKCFADKRECFDATVDACIEELRRVTFSAHDPGDPPAEATAKATAAFLDQLAAKPAMAQLLAWEAVAVEPAVNERYRRLLIPALAALWDGAEAPGGEIDPGLAFGRVQLLVSSETAAGRADRLPLLLPDVVYLAIAPFAGHEAALAEMRRTESRHLAGAARR